MLSKEKLKEMVEEVNNDKKNNKAFIYGECDSIVDCATIAVHGNLLNTITLTACLIDTTIKKRGISRLEYMHELNTVLKAIRGEE